MLLSSKQQVINLNNYDHVNLSELFFSSPNQTHSIDAIKMIDGFSGGPSIIGVAHVNDEAYGQQLVQAITTAWANGVAQFDVDDWFIDNPQ